MNNFKKIISGILVSTTFMNFSFLPLFNLTNDFAMAKTTEEIPFSVENLLIAQVPENEGSNDIIRIPVNPDDGVIRIQTIFVNPSSKVLIDGKEKDVFGYNINDNNFYHLRSLAIALKDTTGRFDIGYDTNTNKISLSTGYNYTGLNEIEKPTVDDLDKDLLLSSDKLVINGVEVPVSTYSIKGTTFVNIKQLSEHLGYILNYTNENNSLNITTNNSICAVIRDVVYNPVFTYDPFTKIELSLDDINKILNKSSLSHCGQYFYNMQETYNVNVVYAIAVAYLESGRGKYPCASHNYFGMIGKNYSSDEEGIYAFGKLMNNKMYKGKSIDKIAPIYCNSAWAGKIKSMMNEIWSYV